MDLAEKVRARREELGLNQTQLAHKMGYKSRVSINKIEKGRQVSDKIIARLAKALEVTPAYLMGWEKGNETSTDNTKADLLLDAEGLEFAQSYIALGDEQRKAVKQVIMAMTNANQISKKSMKEGSAHTMLLIKGGLVKPITSPDIPDGQVLIDGGRIVAVGRELPVPEGCEIYDATGCIVCPGFVEGHCHIGVHEEAMRWEGNDTNEYSNPLTPELRAIDCINPMDEAFRMALEGGVTTAVTGPGSANVMGGTFVAMKLHGNCVDDMVIRNPVAMKIAFGENPKGAYGNSGKKAPVTRMAVAAMLRDMLEKARRYAEKVDAAAADPEKERPYDQQLEALLPVIRKEIPLKAHAHRADDILTALRVAREFDVDITLDHVTEGHLITGQLAEAGKPVLVGPSKTSKSKAELRNRTFATAGILDRAGLEVSIITDAPVIPLYYLPLSAGLAVRAGMDEAAAWRAITINPAKVAGIAHRVGSLEPGKDADVAVFSGDPLRDIQARAVRVYVDGEAVV